MPSGLEVSLLPSYCRRYSFTFLTRWLASGSLVVGIDTANAVVTNATYWNDLGNARRSTGEYARLRSRDYDVKGPSGSTGLVLTSGFGMAQATIGITVALFLSSFIVYPLVRKRRRGAGWLGF